MPARRAEGEQVAPLEELVQRVEAEEPAAWRVRLAEAEPGAQLVQLAQAEPAA